MRLAHVIVLVAVVVLLPTALWASTYSLTDPSFNNGSVSVDPSVGVYDWFVENHDQMARDWYWYRIGSTGKEYPIDTISAPTITQSSSRTLSVSYTNTDLRVSVVYLLTGGTPGSGTSDLAETVSITNRRSTAMDLHFFEYTDFDLCGTATGDTGHLENTSSIVQTDGPVTATLGVNPVPIKWEINTGGALLSKLNDSAVTDLTKTTSPSSGDVEYAMQWDFTSMGAGASQTISKDKLITGVVPEPGSLASLALLASGCLGIVARQRRRHMKYGFKLGRTK